ncbi:RNA-directed DNA polymerase from transposon X-element [Paramuricea clavata]|uniref:RNA-directed DNA polymerase from transposon X-element n=1 Tax=Paramuricea clavata TaxID=317549 RepID=A0A7D9I3P2_PARCT|nr:RNA-directed DNA polymerase from transposon X-element [Paramuricea clavata]
MRIHIINEVTVRMSGSYGFQIMAKSSLMKSMDDKAYIRPGTSEGPEKNRNVKILTLDGTGARKLPKYDWPERLVYQIPAAHRIIEKEGVIMDDGSQKLITKNELHVVVVRPKAYVSSTGTSWANETHRLRCEYPDVHEVPVSGDQSVSYSANFRRFCATDQCDIFMLNDMTMMEDLQKMKLQGPCIHQSYELKRLEHFLHRKEIAFAEVDLKRAVLCEGEGTLVDEIKRYLTPLTTHCSKLAEIIKEATELSSYEELQTQAQEVLTFLESLRLPQVKPR